MVSGMVSWKGGDCYEENDCKEASGSDGLPYGVVGLHAGPERGGKAQSFKCHGGHEGLADNR